MTITNWDISRDELILLRQIADRALNELPGYPDDKHSLVMDLNACHANGCPLDFKGLLEAPLQDFSHDIYGIRDHINRDTGKLEDFFTPRYALANRVQSAARDEDAVCRHCHKAISTVPKHYCPKSPNQMHEAQQ